MIQMVANWQLLRDDKLWAFVRYSPKGVKTAETGWHASIEKAFAEARALELSYGTPIPLR